MVSFCFCLRIYLKCRATSMSFICWSCLPVATRVQAGSSKGNFFFLKQGVGWEVTRNSQHSDQHPETLYVLHLPSRIVWPSVFSFLYSFPLSGFSGTLIPHSLTSSPSASPDLWFSQEVLASPVERLPVLCPLSRAGSLSPGLAPAWVLRPFCLGGLRSLKLTEVPPPPW